MSKPRTRQKPRAPASVADLVADPHNRRLHPARNIGMVVDAMTQLGAARSIVIDENNVILAGNAATTAAAQAGITRVRVIDTKGDELIAVRRHGLTDEKKRALALYDNRAAELAEWNLDQLAADKAAGLEFRPFWTVEEERRLLLDKLRAGQTDPDAIPPVRATTIKRGDRFALGAHRLMCGDSGDAGDVAQLLGTQAIDALISSPPYNLGVKYAQHDDSTQSLERYCAWLAALLPIWVKRMARGRALIWNIGVLPKTAPHQQVLMLESIGLAFVRQFIWQKVGVPVPTFHATRENPRVRRLTSNYTHEMVYVMATGPELEAGPAHALRSDVLEHDVFSIGQQLATVDLPAGDQRTGVQSNLTRRSKKVHPAPFPVALVVAFLEHYAAPGEAIAEPFAGSGSTMIACEQLGLASFGMEIAPEYVQVAIDRWEAFTGQKAQRLEPPRRRRPKRGRKVA